MLQSQQHLHGDERVMVHSLYRCESEERWACSQKRPMCLFSLFCCVYFCEKETQMANFCLLSISLLLLWLFTYSPPWLLLCLYQILNLFLDNKRPPWVGPGVFLLWDLMGGCRGAVCEWNVISCQGRMWSRLGAGWRVVRGVLETRAPGARPRHWHCWVGLGLPRIKRLPFTQNINHLLTVWMAHPTQQRCLRQKAPGSGRGVFVFF